MKISKQDFEELQKKYDQEVKKGKPGKNKKGDIAVQTEWIFFDRETIEKLLENADSDPKKGGIKFYIGQYTEELAEKYFPENPEGYDGMITLVLSAANIEDDQVVDRGFMMRSGEEEEVFENHGRQCPPWCPR